MELKDSDVRREFDSGAVRDIAEGRGRWRGWEGGNRCLHNLTDN
jgi:hypothetical protein